jgi:uncharacterized protein
MKNQNNALEDDAKDYISVAQSSQSWTDFIKYLLPGILFGIVFVKAELFSWFRIQEMFRLQAFHMYGVIGSAVIVGVISNFILKKFNVKTIDGDPIKIIPKPYHKGVIIGGLMFGFGWSITGACPGPLFALIGSGYLAIIVTLISALIGVWIYGYFKERLPH